MTARGATLPLFSADAAPARTWRASCKVCGNSFSSRRAENPVPGGLACPICSVFRRTASRINFSLSDGTVHHDAR